MSTVSLVTPRGKSIPAEPPTALAVVPFQGGEHVGKPASKPIEATQNGPYIAP